MSKFGTCMTGPCDWCRRTASYLERIRVVVTHWFGGISVEQKTLCPACRTKEFLYVDDDGIVRMNRVQHSVSSDL